MAENGSVAAIVAQFADEIGFLWQQRDGMVRAPSVNPNSLSRLDHRLDTHLDGLRVAAESGGQATSDYPDGPGALFGATVLAIESRDPTRIRAMLSVGEERPELQRAMLSAFGWSSTRFLQGTVSQLLSATSEFARQVGLRCCGMHGVDPGEALIEALSNEDPAVRARALQAAGTVGRRDLLDVCRRLIADQQEECAFWAARTSALLGDRNTALAGLARIATADGPCRTRAVTLALQASSTSSAHSLLKHLASDPQQQRWVIQGSGIAGDPTYALWLIDHMRNDQLARLTGESFSLITGLDLSDHTFERPRPENFESGPNDNPEDENVEMDPDEGLPWPDADKVEKWWAANAHRFAKGVRYFMGAPVTREHCIDVLKTGYQRQRILAAHYLCLLDPGTPLFNTSAPAWRQQRLLARM